MNSMCRICYIGQEVSKYLWRCEEYGGLAQIAHGVELGPENKSFTIDCGFVGQSLGVLRAGRECNILSIIKGV